MIPNRVSPNNHVDEELWPHETVLKTQVLENSKILLNLIIASLS